jgi:hypothetical protein
LTTAASTTVANVESYLSSAFTVGASGSVTRFTGVEEAVAQAHKATNNASFADGVAFTGNWFLNQSGTDPSTFGGIVSMPGQLGPATAPSGSCTANGEWVFSQDGHATFCASGTWTTKI